VRYSFIKKMDLSYFEVKLNFRLGRLMINLQTNWNAMNLRLNFGPNLTKFWNQ